MLALEILEDAQNPQLQEIVSLLRVKTKQHKYQLMEAFEKLSDGLKTKNGQAFCLTIFASPNKFA